jgi:undecaprenyl-diphosphatase
VNAELVRAALLGALQGATEFLPVSSSGHLVIVPELLAWPASSLTFDVAVHWATALAVLAYFRSDWHRLGARSASALRARALRTCPEARLLGLLVLASIPAGVVGLLAESALEQHLAADPRGAARAASALLLVTGSVLLISERWKHRQGCSAEDIAPRGALAVGLAQAAAILPGISRSGATIAVGLLAGLSRPQAARFSFLLATPIILAAGVLRLADLALAGPQPGELESLAVGFLAAFAVGYAAIGWLLRYLHRASLAPFAAYTWALGTAALWLLR